MRKTSVYLSDEEAQQLRLLAIRDGRPQAELIREGVRRVIEASSGERHRYRSLGKGRGGGLPYERWSTDALRGRVRGEG